MTPTIDPEFQSLIPPLSQAEHEQLEANIKADGCRDPLVTWRGLLLDGHNRLEICDKHVIPFNVVEVELADRDAAKLWILRTQLGRRNLPDDVRAVKAAIVAREEEKLSKRQRAVTAGKAGGRGRENSLAATVDAKLTEKRSGRSKETVAKSAGVSERRVRRAAALIKSAPDLAAKVSDAKMRLKDAEREVRQRETRKARHKAAVAAAAIPLHGDMGVRHGDFRDIAKSIDDESVDLIFTDPPYLRTALPLFGDMASVAARVLKPGGSLITFSNMFALPETINLITPHLRWWWPLACVHSGESTRMREHGVIVCWKPMLWFVKGTRGDKLTYIEDVVDSRREKDAHEWQQSVVEASYYIDKLTMPGNLVFDPFCGGGTTAVAAKQLNRRWLTCDVDADSVALARQRIAGAVVANQSSPAIAA